MTTPDTEDDTEELGPVSLPPSTHKAPARRGSRQLAAPDPGTARNPVGIGSAHGKAILLGEHAVVYGAPALAIPVPQLTATASAALLEHPPSDVDEIAFTLTGPGSAPVVTQATNGLRQLVAEFKELTGVDGHPAIDVLVDCMIPPGRGLGSSAACARAVVLALANLFNRRLDAATVFDLVQTSEKVAHGRASGVDAAATGLPYSILFSNGTARQLRICFDGLFVIADSGTAGRTKDAVESLRRRFERNPGAREDFVRRVSSLAEAAVRDLGDSRASDFGARLTANHELLADAGLSTNLIDTLVETALAAGALGAKISGGGLGGCMIALAREPHRAQAVARRLRAAGAVRTWVVPVGKVADHAC